MTTKSKENKQWSDPKDYGLPWVEILPLDEIGKVKAEEVPATPKLVIVPEPVKVEKELPETALPEQEPVVSKEESVSPPPEENVVSENVPAPEPAEEAQKSSKTWVWVAAVLVLTLGYIIFWQMQNTTENAVVESIAEAEVISEPEVQNNQENSIENSSQEEIQNPDNQNNIADSLTSDPSAAQIPETGTTIDQRGEGSLIRVEEKAARPQYFIVVGSLPNERLALEESNQYFDRAETLYLINPYEDVKNYRLAIGQYSSFNQASQDLERVKADYTEALWILKY